MLTLKQSPAAIILMLSACSLAEGEPEPVPIRTGKKEGFLIEKDIKNDKMIRR